MALVLVVAVSSMVFAVTAFSLLGFYRGFTVHLGEGADVVAIYDRASSAPFTGLVPAYLVERVACLNGVLACSPEVHAPCVVNGQAFFIRGVVPEEFLKFNSLTVLKGEMLGSFDLNFAVLGFRAAEKLNLKVNDRFMVFGVLTDRCLELNVKGIYLSNSPLDDEVLVPLHVGQWLRGNYGYVTLIRVKIDRAKIAPEALYREIVMEASAQDQPPAGETPKPLQEAISPRIVVRFKPENVGVEEAQGFMKSYLDRYGLTREVMLILSAVVFFFSSLSITAAARTVVVYHKGEIGILRSIGASRRVLKWDLMVKLVPWAMAASLIGVAVAVLTLMAVNTSLSLELLSYRLVFDFDPIVIALPPILSSLLVSIYILKAEVEV